MQGLAAAVNAVRRTSLDEAASGGGRLERHLLRLLMELDKNYHGGQTRLDILGTGARCEASRREGKQW